MIERLENPVFRQSSRQRMRGVRTYGCLVAYLLILGLVVVVSYNEFMAQGVQRSTAGLAQTLFETLVATQWFLVAFITPALTTSAITMEREQRTYELLIMTPLSRFAIVWGKFASALAFMVVMILCGMPLVAVLFLMGGVDTGVMLERYAGMLITGALLAAFGLMMSAICSSTTLANVLTYGALASAYFAGMVIGIAFVMSRAFGGSMSASMLVPGIGLAPWQFWVFVAISVSLLLAILLQIAANYLLPDPRQGAWKTRLLTAILYLWSLGAALITARGATFPASVSNYMAMVVATSLATITPIVATGGTARREKMVPVVASTLSEGGDGAKRVALFAVITPSREPDGPVFTRKDAHQRGGMAVPGGLRLVGVGFGIFCLRANQEPLGGFIPAGGNNVPSRAILVQCASIAASLGMDVCQPFHAGGTVWNRPPLRPLERSVLRARLSCSNRRGSADAPKTGSSGRITR
ncbi:MAG: hypothetical protein KatS3mg023_1065 [Armatimonadota bacterium]|nr:MAG: hypothetical protein KatS3mg023_1065 [Armatimonadota bacterium]